MLNDQCLWKEVPNTCLGEKKGDNDKPDDIVVKGTESSSKGEGLCGDSRCHSQECPGSCWQWLQD